MKNKKTGKITVKMSFAEVMKKYPKAAKVLFEKGMACMGCPMAMQETIEQGAIAHGIDPKKLIEELNGKSFLQSQKPEGFWEPENQRFSWRNKKTAKK